MASALIVNAGYGLYVGGVSYIFCRAFNQHHAFEKAVLVTVLVGLRELAKETIQHRREDEYQQQPLTKVMITTTTLLAIPCTLYAGRVFNFKATDYLQIVGLTSLGYIITHGLKNLYQMFHNRESK